MSEIIQSTYGEVENFYKELFDAKTPRVKKFMVYGTYSRAMEQEQNLKHLEDSYMSYNKGKKPRNFVANLISSDIVIFEDVIEQGVYYPCLYNNEIFEITVNPLVCTTNKDEAILMALAIKYTGETRCIPWIEKLMDFEIEEAEEVENWETDDT